MSSAKNFKERVEITDFQVGNLFEPMKPWIEVPGLINRQRFVGPEARQHSRSQPGRANKLVMSQIVSWVVGGAHSTHIKSFKDCVGGHLAGGQTGIGFGPNAACTVLVQ